MRCVGVLKWVQSRKGMDRMTVKFPDDGKMIRVEKALRIKEYQTVKGPLEIAATTVIKTERDK